MRNPRPRRFLATLCVASLLTLCCAEPAAPTLITAADLFNIKTVESPALSPDGKWVAYVLRTIEPDLSAAGSAKAEAGSKDSWIYRTQLWLAATDGQTPPRQLTFGPARNSSPAWSPAGDRLAFVRNIEK